MTYIQCTSDSLYLLQKYAYFIYICHVHVQLNMYIS